MTAPTFDYHDLGHLTRYVEWGRHPEVGFHLNVPDDVYFSWAGVSNSGTLKPIARSPGHYQHSLLFPWDGSKSADMGTAVDLPLLDDVELVAQRFAVAPFPAPLKKDGTPYANWLASKGGQQWTADMAEAGITVFSMAEAFQIFGMVLAVRNCPEAMDLIRPARKQVAIVWDQPVEDHEPLRCKARLDWINGWDDGPPYEPGDLKTTSKEIDPLSESDPFMKQASSLRYDRQAGFYCMGLEALTGVEHDLFRLVAVESSAPHPVGLYGYEGDVLDNAKAEVADLLQLFADCRASGQWPSYVRPPADKGYFQLKLSRWARM